MKIHVDTYFIELFPDHLGSFFRVLSRFKCLTVIGIKHLIVQLQLCNHEGYWHFKIAGHVLPC